MLIKVQIFSKKETYSNKINESKNIIYLLILIMNIL